MNPPLGIALKLGAVTAFVAMQVLIKSTEGRVPPGEVVFFRSFFAFPVILAWLAWTRELRVGLRTDNPMSHVWRGVVGTSSMGLGFAGLQRLPLPEVTAISYAAPILTVIFAAMFLGEQVRVFRLTAVMVGLVGVMIVLAPRLLSPFSSSCSRTFRIASQSNPLCVQKRLSSEAITARIRWGDIRDSGRHCQRAG